MCGMRPDTRKWPPACRRARRGPGHIRCEISDRKTRAYRAVIRSVATDVQVMMMAMMNAPV